MGDRLVTIDMGRNLVGWGCAPFFWGEGASNTTRPGPRPTFVPSGILIHLAVWPQQTWTENWVGLYVPPFLQGEPRPHLTQCRMGEAYLPIKWHVYPSSRLATTYMGHNLGYVPIFFGGGELKTVPRKKISCWK